MVAEKKLEKNLFKLALPLFIELLFSFLLGTVDTVMLSHYNEASVEAVTNANTIINFLLVLLNVVSVGIAVVISNYLGAKNEAFAKKAISTAIIFNVSLGMILFLFFQFFGTSLFSFVDTRESIFLDSSNYLRYVTLGIPFISITYVLSASLRSYGKPKLMMYVSLAANVINVILNYILINDVFHTNIPAITGINGAAIGTLVSNIFSFVVAIILVKKIINPKLINLSIDKLCLKQIFRIGLPSALENVAYNISQLLILKVVNNLANEYSVLARGYVFTIITFIYLFSCAFANANQILVGYNVGEKNYEAAYKGTNKAFKIALPCVLTATLILNLFGPQFIGIFSKQEGVIKLACSVLPIIFLLELGRTSNLVYIQALKGAGDTVFPLIIGIISMLLIAALGSYIMGLKLGLGLIGVFLAYAFDEGARGICVFFRWRSKIWTKKSIIKDDVNHAKLSEPTNPVHA